MRQGKVTMIMYLYRIKSWIKRETSGVSAVEFAMIAPFLLMLLWGSVALSSSYTLARRVTTMASSAADLVARCVDVNNQDLEDIRAAAAKILSPFVTTNTNPTIEFVSISKDTNGNMQVDWSYPGAVSTPAVNPDLIDNGSSVIMARVEYQSPPNSIQQMFATLNIPGIGSIAGAPTVYSETFYAKPRRSLKVNYTPNGEDCPE